MSFIGDGIEEPRLREQASRRGLRNVKFFGRVPMSEVGARLEGADVLLAHLGDDPLFRMSIPSKTQAYLAMGKPVLMVARGDAADLIELASCGVTCRPRDPRGLADAIMCLAGLSRDELQDMGEEAASSTCLTFPPHWHRTVCERIPRGGGRGGPPAVRGARRGLVGKRFLDVYLSALALLLLSIPMVVIWAVVRAKMGPPAIFRQTRPGLDGELFTLYKFRTMGKRSWAFRTRPRPTYAHGHLSSAHESGRAPGAGERCGWGHEPRWAATAASAVP